MSEWLFSVNAAISVKRAADGHVWRPMPGHPMTFRSPCRAPSGSQWGSRCSAWPRLTWRPSHKTHLKRPGRSGSMPKKASWGCTCGVAASMRRERLPVGLQGPFQDCPCHWGARGAGQFTSKNRGPHTVLDISIWIMYI